MSEHMTDKPQIWVISADPRSYAALWRNIADRVAVTHMYLSEQADGDGLPVFGRTHAAAAAWTFSASPQTAVCIGSGAHRCRYRAHLAAVPAL